MATSNSKKSTITKTKAKIDIYTNGRVFLENASLTTMQIIAALDEIREGLRRNLTLGITKPGPELEQRIKEHKITGRFEFYITDKSNEESANNSVSTTNPEQLPDTEENPAKSGETDRHDLRNQDGNSGDSERLGNSENPDGHDAPISDRAAGPGDGYANQDTAGNNREGGM
ncbi:hypothetical protein [Larkinella arboricola]